MQNVNPIAFYQRSRCPVSSPPSEAGFHEPLDGMALARQARAFDDVESRWRYP